MNNPNHISESLETIFWVKILKFLMRIRDGKNSDPGRKKFGSGIRVTHHGSATLLFPHNWYDLRSTPGAAYLSDQIVEDEARCGVVAAVEVAGLRQLLTPRLQRFQPLTVNRTWNKRKLVPICVADP
jgi:hypothetical protein